MKLLILLFLPFTILPQQSLEQELDSAFINAKKGIYWGLSNIDTNKARMDKELISNNRLLAAVKVYREFEGVKIESKGFFNSVELSVKLYRSDDYLKLQGYIKEELPSETGIKRKKGS